jgi:hypothetical protein
MASIHKKKLRSGRFIWLLTHGKEPNRIRMKAGDTRQEAEANLSVFKRQLAQQGAPPTDVTLERALTEYVRHLEVNRRHGTSIQEGSEDAVAVLSRFSCARPVAEGCQASAH